MKIRNRALGVAAATCVVLAGAPGAASAEPTLAELRVEGENRVQDTGTLYVNDTTTLQTAPSQCDGSGEPQTVSGPSAIGIVNYAKQVNPLVRPFFASDKFDFGLIVCRIGSSGAFSASQSWLYKVDHREAQVGGDQFPLRRGDEVLWYFADFETGENTGAELELRAPGRVRPGEPFRVRAIAYNGSGEATPAGDVSISGSDTAVTGSDGTATLTVEEEGTAYLRGRRGNDIPAAPRRVCVNEQLSACPPVEPTRVFGTDRADEIKGTPAPNQINARGGDDRIDVRESGSDSVSCGSGEDNVLAYRSDEIAADCERVNGRPQA